MHYTHFAQQKQKSKLTNKYNKLNQKIGSVMLLSYLTSSLYILILGSYWIFSFATKMETLSKQGIQTGNIISLCFLCALIVLILASIIYFCYLKYKLRLNKKQILSKTIGQNNKGFVIFMTLDVLLWVIIYAFTVYEQIQHLQDFIKLHCLFVIMIMYVSSFSGLRWFGLKRGWQICFFVFLIIMTAAMYFLQFYYFSEEESFIDDGKSRSIAKLEFNHYISGPLIITFQCMYLSLQNGRMIQKTVCKIIQLVSAVIFGIRVYELIASTSEDQFFSFDIVWVVILLLLITGILIKDIYQLVMFILNKNRQKSQQIQIQKFRQKIMLYLQSKSPLNTTELNLNDFQCPICFDKVENQTQTVRLDCNHSFHFKCIFQWFGKETTCPICRNLNQIQI